MTLEPAINTMSGATLHPCVMMLLMSCWYFVVFLLRVFAANLSLQFVNSTNCMVSSWAEASGRGGCMGGR